MYFKLSRSTIVLCILVAILGIDFITHWIYLGISGERIRHMSTPIKLQYLEALHSAYDNFWLSLIGWVMVFSILFILNYLFIRFFNLKSIYSLFENIIFWLYNNWQIHVSNTKVWIFIHTLFTKLSHTPIFITFSRITLKVWRPISNKLPYFSSFFSKKPRK